MSEESTTPDLIEFSQRVVDAVSARDIDALMSFFAPHAVFDSSPLVTGILESRETIRGLFKDWLGAYEDYEAWAEEMRDLGNGVSFVVNTMRGRLPGSTGWIQVSYAAVSAWADGLIEWSRNYTDIAEGRAAAERLAEERP